MRVEILVPGQSAPQPRHRVGVRGGVAHAYIPKEHPIHVWRETVKLYGTQTRQQLEAPCGTRCTLEVAIALERPKGHWDKSKKRVGQLTKAAPAHPGHAHGDVSNHLKGIEDALVDSGLLLDDIHVGQATISKRYAEFGEEPHAFIVLEWEDEQ